MRSSLFGTLSQFFPFLNYDASPKPLLWWVGGGLKCFSLELETQAEQKGEKNNKNAIMLLEKPVVALEGCYLKYICTCLKISALMK